MTQVLLIRHASNDWVGDRLAGWTPGVCLNRRGHAEAAALAARLADHRLDAVYASPLERTLETAAYLAAPRGLRVEVLDDLGEVRFGTWTGQKLEALRRDPLWAAVQGMPSLTRFPGGETFAETQARAVSAVEGVRAAHGAPRAAVALVSHADVIKLLVAYYAGIHLDLFQRIEVSPASITIVRFTTSGPQVLAVNATSEVPRPPEPAGGDTAADAGAVRPTPVESRTER